MATKPFSSIQLALVLFALIVIIDVLAMSVLLSKLEVLIGVTSLFVVECVLVLRFHFYCHSSQECNKSVQNCIKTFFGVLISLSIVSVVVLAFYDQTVKTDLWDGLKILYWLLMAILVALGLRLVQTLFDKSPSNQNDSNTEKPPDDNGNSNPPTTLYGKAGYST